MSKKLVGLISVVLVVALTTNVQAGLEGYWNFDQGSGDTLLDMSGNGRDGSILGATWHEGGWDGMGWCLEFDGDDDVVELGSFDVVGPGISISAWVRADDFDIGDARIISKAVEWLTDDHWWMFSTIASGGEIVLRFRLKTTDGQGTANLIATSSGLQVGEWMHWAGTWDGTTMRTWANGVETGSMPKGGDAVATNPTAKVAIGSQPPDAYATDPSHVVKFFDGLIDEVRIYDRGMSKEQIQDIMNGVLPEWTKATDPDPADGAEGVTAPLLEWEPGEGAAHHDIYVGTDPELGPDDYIKRQGRAMNLYWHLPGLTPGTTYYWRIDEIGADDRVTTGDVWSFTAAPSTAWNPSPADGAQFQDPNVDLNWSAGITAAKHELYFGTDETAVANGTGNTFKGQLDNPTFDPGTLALETTYYWRVDEVEMGSTTKHTGDVWSFTTTRPGLGNIVYELWENISGTNLDDLKNNWNYPSNPSSTGELNSFEWDLADTDNYGGRIHGWLYVPADGEYTFWICTDDQGELWLSTDDDPGNVELIAYVKDSPTATGGYASLNQWDKYPSQESEPVSLMGGQRYYIMALWKEGSGGDHCQVAWQGPGIPERTIIPGGNLSPFIALWAYGAKPSNGATNVTQTPTLEWIPGIHATQHDLYFSADEDAVANADTTTTGIYRGRQNTTSYTPGSLEWDTTYYWRVDEVNNLHPDSPWEGSVWSFTTADFVIVDDFEDYNDFTPDRVWQTWRDGFGFSEPPPGYAGNGTGSQVGNDDPPYTEQTTVHSGLQAMTFRYTNDGSTGKAMYSEAQREWTTPQNWTVNGVKALTLWFYGDSDNSAEPLYVGVQDSLGTRKDVNHKNDSAVLIGGWQEWNVDLQEFANAGVNLTSIKKIYIGVGNRLAPQMGGTGTLYFDDIRLYKPRCVPDEAKPAASFNNDCVVDYADLRILTDGWLGTGYLVTPQQPSTAGMVAHYAFENNAQDGSGNAYHGTTEGATAYVPSRAGQGTAMQFSDPGGVMRAGRFDVVGPGITLAAWTRPDDFDVADGRIISKATGPGGNDHFWMLSTIGANHTLRFRLKTDDGQDTATLVAGAGELAAGQWAHVAAVWDGSTMRLYKDGEEVDSMAKGGSAVATDPAVTVAVGNQPPDAAGGTRDYDGLIDDVRIYSRALPAAEIVWLAGMTTPFSEPFDLNVDGTVDLADYAVLADAWMDELLWP
jgi:hypothetical protein